MPVEPLNLGDMCLKPVVVRSARIIRGEWVWEGADQVFAATVKLPLGAADALAGPE